MATNPSALPENSGRITPPDGNYPYGSAQNDTTGATGNGTPIAKPLMDDTYGLQQALLRASATAPSGSADTATDSQYMRAIVELGAGRSTGYDDTGIADAHILTPVGDVQGVNGYFDGMVMSFISATSNTGACTADVVSHASLGILAIKLKGGVVDPAADDILLGERVKLTYRSLPSPHFELSRAGRVIITKVFSTNLSWASQPDTDHIEFRAIGGGGGGGGTDGQGNNTAACSGSGGGGGGCIYRTGIVESTYALTIGAGGLGGAAGNNDGLIGGNTTVVGLDSGVTDLASWGGDGGIGMAGSGTLASAQGGEGGIALNTGAGGDNGFISYRGGKGSVGSVADGAPATVPYSGESFVGGGVSNASGNGIAGFADGGGGTGSFSQDVSTNYAGGDGRRGVVHVTEYLK